MRKPVRKVWPAIAIATAVAMAPGGALRAQTRGVGEDQELFKTVAALDAAVFDAYNRCDLDKLGPLFSEDLEFYHDQGGLTRTRQALLDSVKQNICGKVRRELVAGTLQVHEMKGYGAIETGVHRFYQPAVRPEATGEAQFLHLWQNRNGVWQITRVFSYDHQALK